jgi:hypothetical protein
LSQSKEGVAVGITARFQVLVFKDKLMVMKWKDRKDIYFTVTTHDCGIQHATTSIQDLE